MPDPVMRQLGFGAPQDRTGTDPLGEQACSPVPGIIRRYPDRALLLATKSCFVNCAFCTRQAFVRSDGGSSLEVDIESSLAYLRSETAIREVLVSGGDPLTLDDGSLDRLLGAIRKIDHVRLVRVATRAPMARPGRVTPGLARMLASHGPLMACVHFNHPAELTPEARAACATLVDAGLPVLDQTVLLAGVNDDADTLATLFFELAALRVRPYYLLSCDRIHGTEEFWVKLERALDIAGSLLGRLPGHAIPAFVVDLPGFEGKARLTAGSGYRRVRGGHMIRGASGAEVFLPET